MERTVFMSAAIRTKKEGFRGLLASPEIKDRTSSTNSGDDKYPRATWAQRMFNHASSSLIVPPARAHASTACFASLGRLGS